MYNNCVILFVMYVCLMTEIVFHTGAEGQLMSDLYTMSIITLVIVYIYSAGYAWVDRSLFFRPTYWHQLTTHIA